MRHARISQFTGQALQVNPCCKPSEARSPLCLTELLCHCGRAETGHQNRNLWHHSFSVGTGWCIFHEGQAEARCSAEHVARSGMLSGRPACVRGRWPGVSLRNGALFEASIRRPASLWGRLLTPLFTVPFFNVAYLLLITRPSWVKGFSISILRRSIILKTA